MAHTTAKSAYRSLTDRINLFSQGAPPHRLLYRILEMLFSEKEAAFVAKMPIKPFTARQAAKLSGLREAEAGRMLEALASRTVLLDVETDGETTYFLPPPMAGFFEFTLMKVRGDIDQKLLSELFHQYINEEEDFIRELMACGETNLGRIFVNEPAVDASLGRGESLTVMDWERASEAVERAKDIGIGLCYCRHKASHVGRACGAEMRNCMAFNSTATSLIRHGHIERVDKKEALDILRRSQEQGLVQFGENARETVSFICNCCGCCCEVLVAAKRFGMLTNVNTTGFLPKVDARLCDGCGRCVTACPVEAMGMVSANDPKLPARRKARLDERICLGCAVCLRACSRNALSLTPRLERKITPVTSVHKYVLMAIERGKLQNLIFDSHALWNHRAMAAILGAILRLPPVAKAMASRQMKSRYLEKLITGLNITG
ncbi:MAG: 4Fe-4S dicluster domain-containing protein [Elusimicrobiota bacterium]|jgi:ferredoxin